VAFIPLLHLVGLNFDGVYSDRTFGTLALAKSAVADRKTGFQKWDEITLTDLLLHQDYDALLHLRWVDVSS